MKFHGRNLRKGRVSESGRIYHITTTTYQRKPIFMQLTAARLVINALRIEAENNHADTLAFVVMPDHLHWLMQLTTGDISDVVARIKSVTAHQIGGKVWQKGFHDHALRQEEDMVAIARYIIANPLRGGLVKRVEDYPHWDAVWL